MMREHRYRLVGRPCRVAAPRRILDYVSGFPGCLDRSAVDIAVISISITDPNLPDIRIIMLWY